MRDLFFEPLYPAIMAAIIVVVAILAGVTELRRRQETRALIPAIAFYAVPTLFIGFIATTLVYNLRRAPVEYFACRTQACRELLIEPVREMFKERLILVELGGLALIAVVFAKRNISPVAPISKPGETPDPRKWHFDKNSGEYFRIKGYHKGSVIYDATPYSKRLLQDYKNLGERRTLYRTTFISGALLLFSVVSVAYTFQLRHTGTDVSGGLFLFEIIVMFCSGAMFLGSLLFTPSALTFNRSVDIGPPPVAPRGLEDVEDQKAYGDAGPADLSSIHAALGGNAPSNSSSVAGPRRPLFDE